MKKNFFLLMFLQLVVMSWNINAVEYPNQLYNSSFVKMACRRDSLNDWMKIQYGDGKIDTIRWKKRYLLGTTYDKQSNNAKHFSLHHHFFIPTTSRTLQVKLKGMFGSPDKRTSPVFLFVRKYVNGICITKDSLNLVKTDTLRVFDQKFSLPEKCSEIDIWIQSKGFASFLLDSMDIKVDGVGVAELVVDAAKKPNLMERIDIFKNISYDLPFKTQPTILGIGESVHGSKTLNIKRNQLIFDAIRQNQLDILLVELPVFICDIFNRYVTFVVDTLEVPAYSTISNQEFEDLLQGIRKLNMNRKDNPIQICGFDIVTNRIDYVISTKYAMKIYPDAIKTSTNPILSNLATLNPDSVILKPDICPDRAFWGKLLVGQSDNLDIFFQGLPYSGLRDSTMFENVKKIVDYFGPEKKYIIYAHLGHLAKSSDFILQEFTKSLGYYLSQNYLHDYKVLGLFVGNGERSCEYYKDSTTYKYDALKMDMPFENSVEQFCDQLKRDNFYLTNWQGKSWIEEVYRCRHGGRYKANTEYLPFNISSIDAIYFSKKSEALTTKIIKLYE